MSPGWDMFGTDRMLEALNKDPDVSAGELVTRVRDAINDYCEGAEQFDDITMMCFRYRGDNKES